MYQKDNSVSRSARQLLAQIRQVVVGKDTILLWVLAAILARGHILLEDIPGVGKTTMALAFARVMNLRCSRVQFTPDVLPSDITGYAIPDQISGKPLYQPGAILCNLFLADELNRATSRTQAALLEAMEEGQVTVDGITHPLPQPFTVIATQNPIGAAGTQMLPDSQTDRFLIRLQLGYPSRKDEIHMVLSRQDGNPLSELEPLYNAAQVEELRSQVSRTFIGETVVDYLVQLMDATRHHPQLLRGASPRATLAVTAMAKAIAQLRGRDYVLPADIREVFIPTVAHRLLLTARIEDQAVTPEGILREILEQIRPPKLR